jgi:hypothetical protein
MTRSTRAVYFLTPMLVCLAAHWRAPFIWFRLDDFGWLGLPQEIQNLGAIHTLFYPKAQGTVRVLSERVFFFGAEHALRITLLAFSRRGIGNLVRQPRTYPADRRAVDGLPRGGTDRRGAMDHQCNIGVTARMGILI